MGALEQFPKNPLPLQGEAGTRPTQGSAHPHLSGVQTQSVPGSVPFFHGTLAVAVHIWSLDSEALRAGPTARAGPPLPAVCSAEAG